MMILRCLTRLNLNWIKSYNIKCQFFCVWVLHFCEEKKPEKLRLIDGNFTTLSGQFFCQLNKKILKFEI